MKKIVFALSAVSLLASAAPPLAAPCKDAKGKFVKCPANSQAQGLPQRQGPLHQVR